jgi:uncharacterized protein YeaO (DUF488 family)
MPPTGVRILPSSFLMIQVKRVYDPSGGTDGVRVLVDRLWPRGLSRDRAVVKLWLKDLAPSSALRKWFGHDPVKWRQFQTRYRKELQAKKADLQQLRRMGNARTIKLLYGAKDQAHNHAVVLK